MRESSDPYLYPGTDILRNLFEIRDSARLSAFEANATAARLIELAAVGRPGTFDTAHLKAIHRYLFQEVYAWAGEFRSVNISKNGYLFGFAKFLEPTLTRVFEQLAHEQFLSSANAAEFAERAGYFLGEINAAHPFREGNGRTQREFIRQLGARRGFVVRWGRIAREEMVSASRESCLTGNSTGLARLVLDAIA